MATNEVERVRRLLENLEASDVGGRQLSGGTAASASEPSSQCGPAAVDQRQARVSSSKDGGGKASRIPAQTRCQTMTGSTVARWDRDDEASPSSHPRRGAHAKHVERLLWSDGPVHGERYVPRPVARAVGGTGRVYASRTHMEESIAAIEEDAAFRRIADLVDRRERCASELEQTLSDEGYTEVAVRNAVSRATRCGLVDDARYAEMFIAAKVRQGWGRRRIVRELSVRGIDIEELTDAEVVLPNPEDEYNRAKALLGRKSVPGSNPQQRLARYLVNKGFSFDIAFRAARERLDEDRVLDIM